MHAKKREAQNPLLSVLLRLAEMRGYKSWVCAKRKILLVNKVVFSVASAEMMVPGEQYFVSVETTRIQTIKKIGSL